MVPTRLREYGQHGQHGALEALGADYPHALYEVIGSLGFPTFVRMLLHDMYAIFLRTRLVLGFSEASILI